MKKNSDGVVGVATEKRLFAARVIVDARFLGSGSGLDAYVRHLLPEVARLLPKVEFILLADPEVRLRFSWLDGEQFSIYPMLSKAYSWGEQWRFFGVPRGDLFWSCNFNVPIFFTSPFFPTRTLLVTIHDLMLDNFYATKLPWYKLRMLRVYMRTIIKKAAGIICISGFSRNEIVWRYGLPAGRLKVIRLGVADSWFRLRADKRTVHARPFFLFVGNLRQHKNLVNLIYAFRQVREKTKHDLVIIGSAKGKFGTDSEVLKLMHSETRVYYKGSLSQEQTEQFFIQCDAFVFPSLYEGFGLPPLEAMACGKPVVASYSTAIPEVCNKAVLYFDPLDVDDIAEKMLRVTKDKNLRQQLVHDGHLRARQFTWKNCAKETSELLLDVLQKTKKGRLSLAKH